MADINDCHCNESHLIRCRLATYSVLVNPSAICKEQMNSRKHEKTTKCTIISVERRSLLGRSPHKVRQTDRSCDIRIQRHLSVFSRSFMFSLGEIENNIIIDSKFEYRRIPIGIPLFQMGNCYAPSVSNFIYSNQGST